MTLLSWHEEQTRAPLPSLWKAEDRTGFEVEKDGKRREKDGKGREKDDKRMRKEPKKRLPIDTVSI